MMSTARRASRVGAWVALLTVLTVHSSAGQTRQSSATKSFLWKVQPATGSTVLYVAGSVHALTPDVYPLNPAFERAFESAGTLVEEIDLGKLNVLTAGAAVLTRGLYGDGQTLDGAVSKETLALVAARLKDLGVPVEVVSRMKPWMVAMMLMALAAKQAGFDANLGLDKYFFDKAMAAGKPVKGLETIEDQIDRFDKASLAVQEQLLRSTLADLDTGRQNLKVVVDGWRHGDAAALERSAGCDQAEIPRHAQGRSSGRLLRNKSR